MVLPGRKAEGNGRTYAEVAELYEEYKGLLLREKNLLKTVCFIPIGDYIAQAEMIYNKMSLFEE